MDDRENVGTFVAITLKQRSTTPTESASALGPSVRAWVKEVFSFVGVYIEERVNLRSTSGSTTGGYFDRSLWIGSNDCAIPGTRFNALAERPGDSRWSNDNDCTHLDMGTVI
jgi:hypothetical protein